jgi:enterobactin synthetase component D
VPGLSDAVYATLLFSAKESFFKCLYPLVQRMFYFEHARIVGVDPSQRTFRIELLIDLSREFCARFGLEGAYDIDRAYVHTGLLIESKPCRFASPGGP